jgi:ABC-type microcin C transport system duplicated ATPase subunit YejF
MMMKGGDVIEAGEAEAQIATPHEPHTQEPVAAAHPA